MRKVYALVVCVLFLLPLIGWSQTIVSDGFNNTTTLFTISGTGGTGSYLSGNSAAGDGPAASPFASEGTHGRSSSNRSETLTSSPINTIGYSSIDASFRLASFSIGSTNNGADPSDMVTVEVSPNGGTTFYSTIRILGPTGSSGYWGYTATGTASTAYDGNVTPADFQSTGTGLIANGYSTVSITGLPAISNLVIRITLLNNGVNERWVIDDFKVTGTLACTLPSVVTATAGTVIGANGFTANWNAIADATGYKLDVYTYTPNITVAEWTFPLSGMTVTPSTASANNITKTLTVNGGTSLIGSATGVTTFASSATGWNSGINTKYWQVLINTTGFANVKISSRQFSSNTGPRDFKLQYSLDGITYTDITVVPAVAAAAWTGGTLSSVSLPSACDDKTNVYLRWIMTSNTSAAGGTVAAGGSSRIDDISIKADSKSYVAGYQNFATTNLSEDIAGLSANTTYYYAVRSNNACGSSANSNEISVTTATPCSVATVTSFLPTTGPAGTLVTITGSSFTGATSVKFGAVNASTFSVVNSTTIIAEVPSNAPLDLISVTVGGCTSYSSINFTPIAQSASCNSSSGTASDLFISEVYDAFSGSLSYIEIFNGTLATVDLGAENYVIRLITGTSTITDIPLSGTVVSGATYIVRIGTSSSSCTGFTVGSDNPTTSGFNGNDRIYLRKNGVDVDYVPNPNYGGSSDPGFSQSRKPTAIGPSLIYNAADWVISATENCTDLGLPPYTLTSASITVSTQPSDENDCSAVSFTVVATSTPAPPNYLWKYFNSTTGSWDNASSISIAGVTLSGTATATMNITGNYASLLNYQFYCEISKNTCNLATNAVQYAYPTRPYYRSKGSGNWSNPAIWEMSNSSSDWSGAISTCQYPTKENSSGVFIESPFSVVQDIDINIDFIEIKSGGTLTTNLNSNLTLSDSTVGADFILNGTWNYLANGVNSFKFDVPTGSWQMGVNSTLVKTNSGSAANLRDYYQGGMSTIPSTANWILRYTGADVAFTTANTFYPNLTFESTAGAWSPAIATSRFTGNAGFATIKGNLDVGGAGVGTVTVYNENTNAQPLLINGNLIVRTNSTLTNVGTTAGTGFEVKGDVTIDGTLNATGISSTGLLKFSGVNQLINGAATGVFTLQDVTFANTGTATANKSLGLAGVLTFEANSHLDLNTGFVTIKSTAAATARIAPVPASAIVSYSGIGPTAGRFVIERYFPAKRSWRMITAPVTVDGTKTIFNSWQQGGGAPFTGVVGSGTYVTGPGPDPLVNGFDDSQMDNYSLKTFNQSTSAWDGVPNTRTGITAPISGSAGLAGAPDNKGFFMFVRGDRSASNAQAFNPYGTVVETTLRDTGKIQIHSYTFPCNTNVSPDPNRYTVIGNPYASPVDFDNLTRVNVANKFWAWDPNLNEVGAYVVVDRLAGNITVPMEYQPYTGTINQTKEIQSKQAIIVESTTGATHTVTFNESAKSTVDIPNLFRPVTNNLPFGAFNLLTQDQKGKYHLLDGAVAQYGKEFSNDFDYMDAARFINVNETFGILENGVNYMLHRRQPLTENDTIFFSLKKLTQKKYKFNFVLENFSAENLTGYLEDTYLKTSRPIQMDGSSWIDFEVNGNAASSNASRFRIVFKKTVQGCGIEATIIRGDANVNWWYNAEQDMHHYEVERSVDGQNFETIGTASALNSGNKAAYVKIDEKPAPGVYYYRIKAVNNYNSYGYSEIVKVQIVRDSDHFFVFPNPVTDNNINLQLNNAEKGTYKVKLVNAAGQLMMQKQIVHPGGSVTHSLKADQYLAAGTYQLEVAIPGKKATVIGVVVKNR